MDYFDQVYLFAMPFVFVVGILVSAWFLCVFYRSGYRDMVAVRRMFLGVLLSLAAFFLGMQGSGPKAVENIAEAVFINGSDEVIESLHVDLCGVSVDFENLGLNESRKFKFSIPRECSYYLFVKFVSGRDLKDLVAPVKPNKSYKDEIVIHNYKLELKLRLTATQKTSSQ